MSRNKEAIEKAARDLDPHAWEFADRHSMDDRTTRNVIHDSLTKARTAITAYEAHMRPEVDDVDELEALPVGTLVRCDTGALWEAWDPADGDRWHLVGWPEGQAPTAIPLPARVLEWGER